MSIIIFNLSKFLLIGKYYIRIDGIILFCYFLLSNFFIPSLITSAWESLFACSKSKSSWSSGINSPFIICSISLWFSEYLFSSSSPALNIELSLISSPSGLDSSTCGFLLSFPLFTSKFSLKIASWYLTPPNKFNQ